MSNKPADEELVRFHRYFAVESNNHAWQSTLAPAEEREPLDILRHAYVSAYHWSVVGTEVNEFRANILLAHAHAYCGHVRTALGYVQRYQEYLSRNTVEGWETGFATMVHAQVAHALGDHELHASLYAEAQALIDATEQPGDKEVLMYTWVNIPAP
ncbi:MAG: hypothetical protein ACK5BQ_03135 [Ignavibacteria bacterium]